MAYGAREGDLRNTYAPRGGGLSHTRFARRVVQIEGHGRGVPLDGEKQACSDGLEQEPARESHKGGLHASRRKRRIPAAHNLHVLLRHRSRSIPLGKKTRREQLAGGLT